MSISSWNFLFVWQFRTWLLQEVYGREAVCPFCRSEEETTDPLLLHCHFSWRWWAACMKWWNSEWVCPPNWKSLMMGWFKNSYRKVERVCWYSMFYAVLWSIWKARNDLVFKEERPNFISLLELIKYRCSLSVKASFNMKEYSVCDYMRCLSGIRLLQVGRC